jgi:hypothetical protein
LRKVVREQCWLNEILLSCQWTTEGITKDADDVPVDETDGTEDELQAVLTGTNPRLGEGDHADQHEQGPWFREKYLSTCLCLSVQTRFLTRRSTR